MAGLLLCSTDLLYLSLLSALVICNLSLLSSALGASGLGA